MGGRLEAITPIVPVSDLAVSRAFYEDLLGFELRVEETDYDYIVVGRDGAGVGLVGGGDAAALKATRNNIAAYVWVDDLRALWAELQPRLAELPEGRVRRPFVQEYGMREFHVKDPDGFLIFFGESVDKMGAN